MALSACGHNIKYTDDEYSCKLFMINKNCLKSIQKCSCWWMNKNKELILTMLIIYVIWSYSLLFFFGKIVLVATLSLMDCTLWKYVWRWIKSTINLNQIWELWFRPYSSTMYGKEITWLDDLHSTLNYRCPQSVKIIEQICVKTSRPNVPFKYVRVTYNK